MKTGISEQKFEESALKKTLNIISKSYGIRHNYS